ncbi:hypothetical protein [Bradyrhizobium sp.]|uniref:hypothetical protein n=1 Tax=Bradyrhizobium sp. TaxID=376 RepID=UPI003BAE72DD
MIASSPIEAAAPATHYAYKASLIGAAHQFELTGEGLSFRVAGRSGLWRYAEIAAIRLSYRPVSMQWRRFRADIHHASGARIVVFSTTWQTAALMTPQDRHYRAFIVQLHQRMAEAGSKANLSGGLGANTYAAALGLLALLGTAMAGLLVRAVATDEFAGALFIVGFTALFGWQIGGFVRRNRPLLYSFDHLPEALLP